MSNKFQETLCIIKLVSLAFIVTLMILSCEKAITDADVNDNDLQLIGNWDWLYTQDPRTGEISSPETEKNHSYLRFTIDSKALFIQDGTIIRECNYSTIDTIAIDGRRSTRIELCDRLIPYSIYNDTLRISYAATDGPVEYYKRR